MIVYKDKNYETRADKPNENWTAKDVYVVEDGSELANKIIASYPYYEFVLSDGELIDIAPAERPEPEPDEPTEFEQLSNHVLDVDFRVVMLEMGM